MSSLPTYARLRIGISSCLLGEPVRYDGKSKKAEGLVESLLPHVELIAFCPEVGAGMSVPRPAIALYRVKVSSPSRGTSRLRIVHSGEDVTESLATYVANTLPQCSELDGFVLKARSPSCGVRATPHFDAHQDEERALGVGPGYWAMALGKALPGLPLATEEDLCDPDACLDFLTRAQRYRQSL